MKRIGDMLGPALDRSEVLRAARAQRVFHRWEEVVGPMLASKTTPDRFDHGTLWVKASGSAWAQELSLNKEEVLRRLNALTNEGVLFTDIRVGSRPARERP